MTRKRTNFLAFMMHLTRIKEKAEQEESRILSIYRRLALSAALLLVIMNFLLILDVYVLPFRESVDVIQDISWGQDDKISTGKGRRLYIEDLAAKPGDTVIVRTTVIFDIVERIWNQHRHFKMQRQVHGLDISRLCCFPLFLLGILSLVWRKKWIQDNYIFFVALPVCATSQALLLML